MRFLFLIAAFIVLFLVIALVTSKWFDQLIEKFMNRAARTSPTAENLSNDAKLIEQRKKDLKSNIETRSSQLEQEKAQLDKLNQ